MKTSWNPYAIGAFEAVFRPWMRQRIAHFYMRRPQAALPTNRRVILVSNHVSWWDGFLLRELHLASGADRPLYTLMRKDRVDRFPFFKKMGVIALTHEPPAVLRALRLLQSDAAPFWLSIFPQGRIWPSWKRPLDFQRGVEVFARELAPCALVPVALHVEPLTEPAPSAFIGVGRPQLIEAGETVAAGELERSVEELLDEMADVLAAHGEDAGAAWTSSRNLEHTGVS